MPPRHSRASIVHSNSLIRQSQEENSHVRTVPRKPGLHSGCLQLPLGRVEQASTIRMHLSNATWRFSTASRISSFIETSMSHRNQAGSYGTVTSSGHGWLMMALRACGWLSCFNRAQGTGTLPPRPGYVLSAQDTF